MGDANLKAFADLRLGVDIGGTFTDLILTDDAGSVATAKTGTTPHNPALAVEQGVTLLAERLGLTTAELMSRCSLVVHGTTIATNTLLERRGARTALLTTAGFRDLLEMREGRKISGRYDLLAPPPVPLVPRYLRLSIPERVRYSGVVETPLGQACLAEVLGRLALPGAFAIASVGSMGARGSATSGTCSMDAAGRARRPALMAGPTWE